MFVIEMTTFKRLSSRWGLGLLLAGGLLACKQEPIPGEDEIGDTGEMGETGDTGGMEETSTGDTDLSPETETGLIFGGDTFTAEPVCDPFAQDCPTGEKCVPYGSTGGNWDANKCVPVLGEGVVGDPCSWDGSVVATDSCDENSHCWDAMDIDGELVGVCTEFCGGSADDPVCSSGTSCLITNDGSITLCVETCDPLLQGCEDGLGCFWAGGDFQCVFESGTEIATGEPCGFVNDCLPGHYCAPAELMPDCQGSRCCSSICDLTEGDCGQVGTECVPFFEEGTAPPEYIDVGVCIVPA